MNWSLSGWYMFVPYNILNHYILCHGLEYHKFKLWVRVVVFNATFNNISAISWRSVLLVEETGENHRPTASHWQTLSHNVLSSTPCWALIIYCNRIIVENKLKLIVIRNKSKINREIIEIFGQEITVLCNSFRWI